MTITLKLQEAVLFEASRAVHETVVRPALNTTLFRFVPVPVVAPDRVYEIEASEQLSVAVAFQPVPLCKWLQPLLVVTFCWPVTGQLIRGVVLSFTVTVKEQVPLVFPDASLTE